MASPHGNQNQAAIDDDDENAELLNNDQLVRRSEQYLNILQQRMHQPAHAQQIDRNQVENLITKKKMLAKIKSIHTQFHDLVSSGNVKGFVYGLIANDRSYTAASENLLSWWKGEINFDTNGPLNFTNLDSQTLSLKSLQGLQDTSLSSLISALMKVCNPPQRKFPFRKGVPVDWWPKGTEEWWAEMGFPEDLGPPLYMKPHYLKKLWKVAVLIATIKNIQPQFKLMRDTVVQTLTLQSKLAPREHEIWLAVLRGEEMAMNQRLGLSASSNREGSGANSMITAPEPETVPGPIEMNAADGESSRENNNSVSAEPEEGPASSGSVLAPQDPIEKRNDDGESSKEPEMALAISRSPVSAQGQVEMISADDGENNGANSRKRIATTEPEIIPVSTSSALTKGLIGMTTIDGESSGRRQRLKGIGIDEPELLLHNNQHQGNFGDGLVDAKATNSIHQFARSHCQQSPASARNFLHPSSNLQLRSMLYQRPYLLPGNFFPGLVVSAPNQIQNSARGKNHAGMAIAGAANNNQFAPPFQIHGLRLLSPALSWNYFQYLKSNNLQPTLMSTPAFSMTTPQLAEYHGVPSSLDSNNPNSPSHGMPVCLSQRKQVVRAEYSTPSTAAETNSGDTGIQGTSNGATNSGSTIVTMPNSCVSNDQNQTQQAMLVSTNQAGVVSDIPHQSAQNQAPGTENSMPIGTGIQGTSNAATNDDPLQQPQSQSQSQSKMNEDMNLETLFDGFDDERYMRQLASGWIK